MYDVVVIGGGVVGLTILRAATLCGWKCALIESEPDLLWWASGSNSGIVCTGVDAAPGTLERALLRDSIAQVRPFCKRHNIPTRPCGSLVCLWPNEQAEDDLATAARLQAVLEESHEAGDTHASQMDASRVLSLEPNLNPSCRGAVHIPGEIVVDPWLFSIAYAVHARQNGAHIFTDFQFDPEASTLEDDNVWTVVRRGKHSPATRSQSSRGLPPLPTTRPNTLRARVLVNAAGLWADTIQQQSTGTTTFQARPRRGQYRIFASTPQTRIQHPIQPVPTQRTKGIFVFSTLYDQLVVGPTALDQDSKTDRSIDSLVSEQLNQRIQEILPNVDVEESHLADYVGIRPGTDKCDYQIRVSAERRWITVAGIRSTGLSASLGIGRHVAHLLESLLPPPHVPPEIHTTPLPPVEDLVRMYRERSDGCVSIQGHDYRVTHPLTQCGWKHWETVEAKQKLSSKL